MDQSLKGMMLGFIGVTLFALTLPITHLALPYLETIFIAMGRASIAGIFAGAVLLATKSRRPSRPEWRQLALFASGTVFGFPIFSTLAMETVPASHGGVVLGLLPLLTAMASAIFFKERPSVLFWISGITGSILVILFALLDGGFGFVIGDGALFVAALTVSVSYAYGGRVSQSLGGWQTISWALVLTLPITTFGAILTMPTKPLEIPSGAWISFAYLGLFSQYIGFFFWNHGLAIGGIARVSQVQLLQPFLTLVAASLIVGEVIDSMTVVFACVIFAIVLIGRLAPISRSER